MASPQTIPQVVEVDEARAPPSFGPRSRSIVLLLSAACLAAQILMGDEIILAQETKSLNKLKV